MVRAILAGAKTQTRRVVKVQPEEMEHGWYWKSGKMDAGYCHTDREAMARLMAPHCPYGQPGDRLWVREAHWWYRDEHDPVLGYSPPKLTIEDVVYRADDYDPRKAWRPSIHMPRWASRITLEITGVRVERLQGISEGDAVAEGVHADNRCRPDDETAAFNRIGPVRDNSFPIARYASLWEAINGPDSWERNPFVWVIEFRRVTP